MLWGQSEWELLEQKWKCPRGHRALGLRAGGVSSRTAGDVVSRALWERPRVHVGMDEGLEGKQDWEERFRPVLEPNQLPSRGLIVN